MVSPYHKVASRKFLTWFDDLCDGDSEPEVDKRERPLNSGHENFRPAKIKTKENTER